MSGITDELVQKAQSSWLSREEVMSILQNYKEKQLNVEPPQKPASGSLLLFNKLVLRNYRNDGHNWRKRNDGKSVLESHECKKVGNDEALNCYTARSEDKRFHRRIYWMRNSAMKHIVLVHYRDITIGKHGSGPISALTLGSSNLIQSCNKYTTQPAANEFDEAYNSTPGPSFLENLTWKDVLSYCGDAAHPSDTNEVPLSQQQSHPVEELWNGIGRDTGMYQVQNEQEDLEWNW